MLEISNNSLKNKVNLKGFSSFRRLEDTERFKIFSRLLKGFSVFILILLFLPWTQNIRGKGAVTTLTPDQRPQQIQTVIAGRIERWYVREGDRVEKGDTILYMSEVKDDYFDLALIERTQGQVDAKNEKVVAYQAKVSALANQKSALIQELALKKEQAQNKLIQAQLSAQSDSIELIAAKLERNIAQTQLDRTQNLFDQGLKAVTDVEDKKLKFQSAQAKTIAQENKWLSSKNSIINARVDLVRLAAEYGEKIAKAESEQMSARSDRSESEADVYKLQNQMSNYQTRKDLRYVLAPRDGYINKIAPAGIGETLKEGEEVATILPEQVDLAVETYIRPIDIPLVRIGTHVQILFDGWPTVVFSGWPGISYGTFGGKVVAIENNISSNGMYRLLIAPDDPDQDWPEVRVGSGAQTLALLDDVPIWFELWRNLNGFPPNYYQPNLNENDQKK
jgi:adhesin transport system membrane fusion protein